MYFIVYAGTEPESPGATKLMGLEVDLADSGKSTARDAVPWFEPYAKLRCLALRLQLRDT